MNKGAKGKLGALLLAASMFAAGAQAALVDVLAFKISDSASGVNAIDAWLGWQNAGGFNESNPTAQLLTDNGLDYKNSFVDTQWASVLGVRVAMYSAGVEKAYVAFSPGADKNSFFTQANVTGSTYSDVTVPPQNFFSIAGDTGNDRHWFINNNYGGCPADAGHLVVLDRRSGGSYPCSWENTRIDDLGSSDRGLLYSAQTTSQNWTTGDIGVADVFAVFVTVNDVPEPTPLALVGAGVILLAGFRFRKRA